VDSAAVSQFEELMVEEQIALLEMARRRVGAEDKVDKAVRQSFFDEEIKRLQQGQDQTLVRAAKQFAEAEKFFDLERCTDEAAVDVELGKLPSTTAKLEWLKDQTKIRTKGYFWRDLHVAFSKKGDSSIGTVENLTEELKRVIRDEKGRVPPDEPPVEATQCRKLPVLGTMTVQRKAFDDGDSFTREEMRAKNKAAGTAAAAEKSAREQERHDSNAHGQPETTPEVNEEFVGTCIEVLTEIEEVQVDEKGKEVLDDEGNEVMVYSKQWLPAEVMKLSTGAKRKKTRQETWSRCRSGGCCLTTMTVRLCGHA
jgi:hypothetical protein